MLNKKSAEIFNKELAEVCKAIGHPTRIGILNLLCDCDRLSVKNIYEKLGIDQPSASRHLNIMRSVGILDRKQEAGNTFYCICVKKSLVDGITKWFKN